MPVPLNFKVYMTIWVVLVAALQALRAVAGHALKTSKWKAAKLVELWLERWHIIRQADDSMRSNQMKKVRRRVLRGIGVGKRAPTS